MSSPLIETDETARPIYLITKDRFAAWLAEAPAEVKTWLAQTGFVAAPGTHSILPAIDGSVAGVAVGVSEPTSIWDLGGLAHTLPGGAYRLEADDHSGDHCDLEAACLGWALGAYRFETYKPTTSTPASLVIPKDVDAVRLNALVDGTYLARTLINIPANDMGPTALAAAAKQLADDFDAECEITVGEELLKNNYPAIHAVGRAAADAPRLIELTWGDPGKPTVALVGKGVCFDSGGLDIKPAAGMQKMKKDMGGAAHVLGAAHILMAQGADIHLKVLIPAVENAISGNAMRPLDVLQTRAGITVEIGNTDAEGRVILSDALTRAAEHNPCLIVDFATLTGAARVALGTELPALFCNDDAFCERILSTAQSMSDPLWRMPLWKPYGKMIEGKTADITNAPDGGYGGAITAALFLQRFVADTTPWAHIDVMAWNLSSKPGRPEGGEAMGMRAIADAVLAQARAD